MSDDQLLARADAAWENADRSGALRLLKEAVRNDPTKAALRRALAERYREMGNPDQAGRWGIVRGGWTTDLERDRLARLLAASRIDKSDVAEFLVLPDGSIPDSVLQMLQGPVIEYRKRFQARIRQGYEQQDISPLDAVTGVLWGVFATLVLGSVITVFAYALFDASSVIARSFVLITIGCLSIALAFSAALAGREKAYGWSAGYALAAIPLVALTLLGSSTGFILK